MFSTEDTIVAIATPPGRGGIGVVRISGADAHAIAQRLMTRSAPLEQRRATLTKVRVHALRTEAHASGVGGTGAIDHVVATYFPAPHSYTGDDVVELSAHGSPIVLRAIVETAVDCGARLAEPGEFTLRAFLRGRMDLVQAEAVADLIDAVTPLQARTAFDQLEGTLTRDIAEIDAALFDVIARLEASVDFPEEGYHFVEPGELACAIEMLVDRTAVLLRSARRGRLVRDGLQVAIVGRPNVGKSTLFNALVGAGRAIVTDVPGTTRDLITETVELDGVRLTLVDTAGLRETEDWVEREGVSRARQAIAVADLTLMVVDEDDPPALANVRHLMVQTKADLGRPDRGIRVSAVSGEGMDDLRTAIASALDVEPQRDRPAITNVRHIALVEQAHTALCRARDAAGSPEELVLADLQQARAALEEIAGRRTTEDLLAHIFARFCVGK
jgi:tRNA modification GTPase